MMEHEKSAQRTFGWHSGFDPDRTRDFFTLLGGDASRSDHHVCGPP